MDQKSRKLLQCAQQGGGSHSLGKTQARGGISHQVFIFFFRRDGLIWRWISPDPRPEKLDHFLAGSFEPLARLLCDAAGPLEFVLL